MSRVMLATAAALTVTLLVGCGPMEHRSDVVEIAPKLEDLPAAVRPLHAGVYYSREFAGEEHVRVMGPSISVVPIGPASAQLFDELLPKVFAKTSRISDLSREGLAAKGVDLAIAPTLEYFNWRHGFDSDGPSLRWSVSYRLTLYSPQAVPVASWIVSGDAPEGDGGLVGAQKDLKDAAAKFVRGFERNAGPALAAIARNKGKQAAVINPRDVVLTATLVDLPGLDPKATAALRKAGVVPIQLTAKSTIERSLIMRASDMRLQLKDGQLIEPSSMPSVLNVLEDEEEGYNAWFGGVFFLGSLGGMAAGIASTQSQAERRETGYGIIKRSLFLDRTLSMDKEGAGIVLFRVPKGAQTSGGTTLTAWIVDPSAADGTQLSISIPGLENIRKGAPESAVSTVKPAEKTAAEQPIRTEIDRTPESTPRVINRIEQRPAEQSRGPAKQQWPSDSPFPIGRGGLGHGSYLEHEDPER